MTARAGPEGLPQTAWQPRNFSNRLEEVQHRLVFDSDEAQQVDATQTPEGVDSWDLVVQVRTSISTTSGITVRAR
jgi:hypothetical protein